MPVTLQDQDWTSCWLPLWNSASRCGLPTDQATSLVNVPMMTLPFRRCEIPVLLLHTTPFVSE